MSALSYDAVGNPINSRYYDPVACRFINADSQLNTNEGNTGYNLYSYCGNNPVMYTDPSGHSFILACIIVGAVIGALAGGASLRWFLLQKRPRLKPPEAVKATGILWLHGGGYIVGMKEMVHMSRAVDLVKRIWRRGGVAGISAGSPFALSRGTERLL